MGELLGELPTEMLRAVLSRVSERTSTDTEANTRAPGVFDVKVQLTDTCGVPALCARMCESVGPMK